MARFQHVNLVLTFKFDEKHIADDVAQNDNDSVL